MSGEETEKELRKSVASRLFKAGFFRSNANTFRAINNLNTMIAYFEQNKELFGENFLYMKRFFELSIEIIAKFQSSQERSFNTLTLS